MGETAGPQQQAAPRMDWRKQSIRVVAFAGWGLVLAIQFARTVGNPSAPNLVVAAALAALFVLFNARLLTSRWLTSRRWRGLSARMQGAAYLSEFHNLPNRNYVLAEIRRELPRSRSTDLPFVLIQLSLENIEEVRARRGNDFADRAVNSLAEVLKRLTRSSDFLAHLGQARFCVLLVECTLEQSYIYLRRVPGVISVSDGHKMLDVPVTARVVQYDMEALYATDVLRDLEEAKPLRRRQEPRMDALAA